MTIGPLGVDATHPVNTNLLEYAKEMTNGVATPFFGRYFKGPGNPETIQYQPKIENSILHAAGVKLLPYARQTNHVNGSLALGQADGQHNVDAYFAAIPAAAVAAQGGEAFIFLDIEPGNDASEDYYLGWAQTVVSHSQAASAGAAKLLPCAYLNRANNVPSLSRIQQAMGKGAECHGIMVAAYMGKGGTTPPTIYDWTDARTKPPVNIGVPIIAWQWWDTYRGSLDGVQFNPALGTAPLGKLLVPPA